MAKSPFKWLALTGGLLLCAASSVHAQDSGPLIQLLVKKGLINDQEAEDLRADLTKNFAETNAGKLNLSSSVTELRISGDVRARFEYREGETPSGDHSDRSRWRYRVRPVLSGRVGSQWFYGIRVENSAKARSSNVSMGADGGPFAKTDDGLNIGQVYIGYQPMNELTVYVGRMPNPLVSTPMVWDADINPEGLAEVYKAPRAGSLEWGATLGQFIYDSANPQNVFGATGNKKDQYLLAWQGVIKFYTGEGSTTFFQVAPTLYNYTGTASAKQKNFAGSFTVTNAAAINDLLVLDVPFEYDWVMADSPQRIFADFAYNFSGDERARRYGRPDLDNQNKAYQIGYQYGKAKLKGEWDAKIYYQATGLFSVDQNLIDSDIFDSRVNMKGFALSVNYQLTDAVTATITYANGKRKESSEATIGQSGEPDLGGTTLAKYNLFQADVVLKF